MDGYIQIKEAAKKWEIGERRINELCLNGRIEGAVKFGNTWAIPEDSEKPADARIKSGKYIKDRGDKQWLHIQPNFQLMIHWPRKNL